MFILYIFIYTIFIITSRYLGAYPANLEDSETFDLLTSILKYGTSIFVCLQEEYPDDGIAEETWRHGNAIRPYYEDLKLIVRNKVNILSFFFSFFLSLSLTHSHYRSCFQLLSITIQLMNKI